jgi:hypothetical protein
MLTKEKSRSNRHGATTHPLDQIPDDASLLFNDPYPDLETFPASVSRIDLAALQFLRLPWSTLLTGAALFLAFTAFLAAVQFSTPNLAGNDGYYHIKMAYLMRTEGLKPPFTWLPLTILNEGAFVDHHFLFHVLLVPFTFGDLRLGAKIASVIFPALTFLTAWVLLCRQKVTYAALWAAGLLIVSEAFLYRMSMPRAQSLSLLFLFLGLIFLFEKRYRLLIPLAFLYVWLYNAFPLLILIGGIYTVVIGLVEKRFAWRPLAYITTGAVLGLVINPYFPENLIFQFHHIGGKLFDPTAIRVGNEWYPYDTTQLIENSGPTFIVLMAGILALGFRERRMDVLTGTSLLLAFLFGAMVFESRRFIEYFPPFVLLFAALAIAPFLAREQGAVGRRRRWAAPALFAAVLLYSGISTLQGAQHSLQSSKPYQRYALASTWLAANTAPGDHVFQTDWDDFPALFFYNTHNTYTIGLDPTYMEIQDPDLFERWVDIGKGKVDNPSGEIRETFNAEYVLTDLKHDEFLKEARNDPAMIEMFADDYAVVFRILSEETAR